jgi:DNA-binding NarL/FixJ family response regulator
MRIVIAEDAAILRDGMTALLTMRGHDVVAVGDAAALFASVPADQPDVAVVDIRMPPTFTDEGLRAALGYAGSSRRWGCCCSRSTSSCATRPSCWTASPTGSGTC